MKSSGITAAYLAILPSMQLTTEQQNVLNTDGNLVINAVAGSGKTSTLIAYAKTRSSNSKILYIAFNKTVKTEAIQKFAAAGVNNVRVETAHSLAFDHIVKGSAYRLNHGFKSQDWCEILKINTGDPLANFIIANHVGKFLSYYCNSNTRKIQDLDYNSVVSDPKAAAFVKNFYTQIERLALEALAKMDNGEIEITHDFYLKKFQLSEPTLSYDYILFDEGQDASAAMLEVFLKQKGKKIIVGDMHQQIYGWRYAINSLQQVDFPIFNLSNSFRFDEEVALVANKILSWKKYLQKPPSVKITGVGPLSENNLTKAILGRTNLTLLLNAISRWQQGDISKLYFEGNINSYTFADEGASLYDVLNLYNGKFGNIRDKLIAGMKSMRELEEYIDKTEDNSLAIIVEVVKQFGNRLPSLINELKTHHTATKEEAEMIFSTVHRCKGMEYDEVTLLNDFINEEKLKRQIEQNGGDKMNEANRNRLAEEVNVLYVAATRAKNKLCIPPEINPLKSIEISQTSQGAIPAERKSYIPDFKWAEKTYRSNYLNEHRSSRGSSNEMKGITYGKRWTPEEKEEVMELFQQKLTVKKIAEKMRRTPLSIKFKLMDLGVHEEEIF